MQITRRGFLKGSAAGVAAIGISGNKGIFESIVPEAHSAQTKSETYVNSTCRECPGRCGIRVRVVNGRAVKIEGNPLSPINYYIDGPYAGEGGLCPKGSGAIWQLYDPDRVKSPMKRTNPVKGIDVDPKFVPVTWDEALNDIAGRLKRMRAEGKAKTLLTTYGRGMGPTDAGALKAFIQLYGSPNQIGHGTICAEGSKKGKEYTDGVKTYSVYDYGNTNYLLIFGANFLESFRPLSLSLRSYGYMRRGRGHRTKIVYFDTRPSVTGSKADESYMVRPASDGAIALGMAHTILTESLWNRKFVGDFVDGKNRFVTGAVLDPKVFEENWTHGLIQWWNMILKDFSPETAEKISGVPAGDIKRIAREFATSGPAIALFERGATCYQTGTYNAMAIHSLNALVGSLYAKGGISEIQESTPFGSWPAKVEEYMDEVALATWEIKKEIDPKTGKEKVEIKEKEKKFPKFQDMADTQIKGDPYKASMLFVWMTNPFFSPANPQRFWEAFKDTFIVTFTSWVDDTSIYADYILPDPPSLESLWAAPVYPSVGYPCAALIQPVISPLFDTKSFFDVLAELGKRIGGRMSEYYKKLGSLENVLSAMISGEKIGSTLAEWKARGVWYKKGPLFPFLYHDGKFYDQKENKIASAETVKEKVFKTPSGKFEFRSGNKEAKIKEKVAKELEKKGIKDPKVIEAKQKEEITKKEKDLYPQYKEPEWVGGPGFDLFLNTAKLVHHSEGRSANHPILQESFDILNNRGWGTNCWIHPKTAQQRGIKDGDGVFVESPIGKIKAKALINPGCHPQVVVVPFGHGHKKAGAAGYGRYTMIGANPNEIIKNLSDPDSGLQSYYQTMVKVYKA